VGERNPAVARGGGGDTDEPAQALYRGVSAQSTDEEIGSRRQWVFNAKAEDREIRTATFQSGGAEKQARTRFKAGIVSAEALAKMFDLPRSALPRFGFPGADDPALPEMEELYLQRTQRNYELSPTASLEDAGRVALASVLQEYHPYWNGRSWRWMRQAPGLTVGDPDLINENLDAFLQEHGYTLESERYKRMAAAGAAGILGEAGVIPEIPIEPWTPTRVNLLPVEDETGGPAAYYVQVWDPAIGWKTLVDERPESPTRNLPLKWGGPDLVKAAEAKQQRMAAEEAAARQAEREQIARDWAWAQQLRDLGFPAY